MLASNLSFLDEPIPDAPSSVGDKVLELLGKHSSGMLGSDIPRFFQSEYGERLQTPEDPTQKDGRMKLKDFLLTFQDLDRHSCQNIMRVAAWGI